MKTLAVIALALVAILQIVTVFDSNGNVHMYSITQAPWSSSATVLDVNTGNVSRIEGLPTNRDGRYHQTDVGTGEAVDDYNRIFSNKPNRRMW